MLFWTLRGDVHQVPNVERSCHVQNVAKRGSSGPAGLTPRKLRCEIEPTRRSIEKNSQRSELHETQNCDLKIWVSVSVAFQSQPASSGRMHLFLSTARHGNCNTNGPWNSVVLSSAVRRLGPAEACHTCWNPKLVKAHTHTRQSWFQTEQVFTPTSTGNPSSLCRYSVTNDIPHGAPPHCQTCYKCMKTVEIQSLTDAALSQVHENLEEASQESVGLTIKWTEAYLPRTCAQQRVRSGTPD